MSKELKFRAWDFERKRMVYFQQLEAVTSIDGSIKLHAYGNLHSSGNISPLMQFTGLLGKDGENIWERDLLVMDDDMDALFEVFYHDGAAKFDCGRVHYRNSRCGCFVPAINSNRLKVVGNFYANPELLNL